MSRKRLCEECSCWSDYPSENHKRKHHWRCVDDYINIDNREGYKHKTHCIRKDVIFGFIKEGKK